MDTDYKSIIIISVIIVALFAGGLFYVISESNNRKVALELTREYITSTDSAQQASLEVEIRRRIEKPPIAMTSRASFDSFEQLIANARACEYYEAQILLSTPETAESNSDAWRYCMDNPAVLDQKNQSE